MLQAKLSITRRVTWRFEFDERHFEFKERSDPSVWSWLVTEVTARLVTTNNWPPISTVKWPPIKQINTIHTCLHPPSVASLPITRAMRWMENRVFFPIAAWSIFNIAVRTTNLTIWLPTSHQWVSISWFICCTPNLKMWTYNCVIVRSFISLLAQEISYSPGNSWMMATSQQRKFLGDDKANGPV